MPTPCAIETQELGRTAQTQFNRRTRTRNSRAGVHWQRDTSHQEWADGHGGWQRRNCHSGESSVKNMGQALVCPRKNGA